MVLWCHAYCKRRVHTANRHDHRRTRGFSVRLRRSSVREHTRCCLHPSTPPQVLRVDNLDYVKVINCSMDMLMCYSHFYFGQQVGSTCLNVHGEGLRVPVSHMLSGPSMLATGSTPQHLIGYIEECSPACNAAHGCSIMPAAPFSNPTCFRATAEPLCLSSPTRAQQQQPRCLACAKDLSQEPLESVWRCYCGVATYCGKDCQRRHAAEHNSHCHICSDLSDVLDIQLDRWGD